MAPNRAPQIDVGSCASVCRGVAATIIATLVCTISIHGARADGKVSTPSPSLGLHAFYEKYFDCDGLPLVAAKAVDDRAFSELCKTVRFMTRRRTDLLRTIVSRGVKFAIIGKAQKTTDIPEYADLVPRDYWNQRTRGLGATPARRVVSCSEENILRLPEDPYSGEDICVHEFSHTILTFGAAILDPQFNRSLQTTFEAARKKGLWKNTYAMENYEEYWAEGVQSWFGLNLARPKPDGVHGPVNGRRETTMYDPQLAILIDKWFSPRR